MLKWSQYDDRGGSSIKGFFRVCITCVLLLFVLSSCGESENKETYLYEEETVMYPESIKIGVEETEHYILTETTEYTSQLTDMIETSERVPEHTDQTTGQPEQNTEPETEYEPLGYVAPEGWYAPKFDDLKIEGGDYSLEEGVMGLKVFWVQRVLGGGPRAYYRQEMVDRVAFFQSENGLEISGIVDLDTWLAMGLDKKEWTELGTFDQPVAIEKGYDRDQIIEVFLKTAESYIDTPYIVGASGKPGQGVDCSGLVLQCMYSIGIRPDIIDPVQHSTLEEYNSRLMWADPKLKEIDRGDIMPGDLVFYQRPGSFSVCHVAIFRGDEECIEALKGVVEILPIDKDDYGYAIMGYKRIIAE